MKIISIEQSKHKKTLVDKGEQDVPIGVIDDVEVIFLHYRDPQIALEKWNRRCKRINWNNLVFKFSYMNECNDDYIRTFEKMNFDKSVVLSHKAFNEYSNVVVVSSHLDNEIDNDTFYWNKFFDTTSFLNGEGIKLKAIS